MNALYPIFLQRQMLQLPESESLEFRHAVRWHSTVSCSATVGFRMPWKARVTCNNEQCAPASAVFLFSLQFGGGVYQNAKTRQDRVLSSHTRAAPCA